MSHNTPTPSLAGVARMRAHLMSNRPDFEVGGLNIVNTDPAPANQPAQGSAPPVVATQPPQQTSSSFIDTELSSASARPYIRVKFPKPAQQSTVTYSCPRPDSSSTEGSNNPIPPRDPWKIIIVPKVMEPVAAANNDNAGPKHDETKAQASVSNGHPAPTFAHVAAHKQLITVAAADGNPTSLNAPHTSSPVTQTSPTFVNNTSASQSASHPSNSYDSPSVPINSPLSNNSAQDQAAPRNDPVAAEVSHWDSPFFQRNRNKNKNKRRNRKVNPPQWSSEADRQHRQYLAEQLRINAKYFEQDPEDQNPKTEEQKQKEAAARRDKELFEDDRSVIFDPVLPPHAIQNPDGDENQTYGAEIVVDPNDQEVFPTPAEAVKMQKEYAAKVKEMPKPAHETKPPTLSYTVPRVGSREMPRQRLMNFYHGEREFKSVFAMLRSREKFDPNRVELDSHFCRERDALEALAAERNELVSVGKQISVGGNRYTLPPLHNVRSRETADSVARWLWFHKNLEVQTGRPLQPLQPQMGSSDTNFLVMQSPDKHRILTPETRDRIEDWTYTVVTNMTRNPYSVDMKDERWQWGLTLEWGMRHEYQELPPDYIFPGVRLDYDIPDWQLIRALKHPKLNKITRWDQTAHQAMLEEMKHQEKLAYARGDTIQRPKLLSDLVDFEHWNKITRLRPATPKDLEEVRLIWNWHIRNTFNTGHNKELTMDYIKKVAYDIAQKNWPFLVAVERIYGGAIFCQDTRPGFEWKVQLLPEPQRAELISEKIMGFVLARDYHSDQSCFEPIPKLELYIHDEFFHKGLGPQLLNKALEVMTDQAPYVKEDFNPQNKLHESEVFKKKVYAKVEKVVVQLFFQDNFSQVKARESLLTQKFGFVTAGMFSNWCSNIYQLKYSMILMFRDTHEQKQRERTVAPPPKKGNWPTREELREMRNYNRT